MKAQGFSAVITISIPKAEVIALAQFFSNFVAQATNSKERVLLSMLSAVAYRIEGKLANAGKLANDKFMNMKLAYYEAYALYSFYLQNREELEKSNEYLANIFFRIRFQVEPFLL